MDKDTIARLLVMTCQTLGTIPTPALEAHVTFVQDRLNSAHSIGAILDPTAYRDSLDDGSFEDAENQLEIAEALLAVRRAIDKREAAVRKHRKLDAG